MAPPPLEPAAVRKAPSVASVIAKDMTVEGGMTGEGELHVDGVVRGDVRVGRLTIGETGHIEGTIAAELVECRGKVVGSITAKQVRLFASSHVDGDITHEQLAMETGASFQGRSLKFQRQGQPRHEGAPTGDVINLGAAAGT
jgi:cytoskeletal protein CcmA (bactofilin family)